jgi:hypothetical protein
MRKDRMTKRWYSVGIDARAQGMGLEGLEALVEAAERQVEEGSLEGPIVSGLGDPDEGLGLRVSVTAEDVEEALRRGMLVFRKAVADAGIETLEIAHVEVHTEEALENWLAGPAEEYAGVTEVAKRLGVSKQRVSQLRGMEGFPEPVAELAAGPVWRVSHLQRFIQEWPRRPGRPASVSDISSKKEARKGMRRAAATGRFVANRRSAVRAARATPKPRGQATRRSR